MKKKSFLFQCCPLSRTPNGCQNNKKVSNMRWGTKKVPKMWYRAILVFSGSILLLQFRNFFRRFEGGVLENKSTVSKWRQNNRFLFRVISILAKTKCWVPWTPLMQLILKKKLWRVLLIKMQLYNIFLACMSHGRIFIKSVRSVI